VPKGVERNFHRKKIKRSMETQHICQFGGVLSVPIAKNRLLSFNMAQTWGVTGAVNGHKILRRHHYIVGMIKRPQYMRYGGEEENSVHVLCACGAVASFRQACLGSFFLGSEDIRSPYLGAMNRYQMTGSSVYVARRACPEALRASGPAGLEPIYYSIFFYCFLSCANLLPFKNERLKAGILLARYKELPV
jgi:hypothetical protein